MIHRAFPPEQGGESGDRELRAVHEIAQALLASDGARDVYTLALQRVTGLVGALFSCVFLRSDSDKTLLEPVATHRWPRQYTAYLDHTRVRVGRGPTGRAVSSREPVEVFDIHANPALEEWWEPARELGFSSAVALPLIVGGEARGALTFYFAERAPPPAATRSLLLVVADQLAAAAEKAHLIEHLRSANVRLEQQNQELEVRIQESEEARRLKEEFLANISHELRTPLTAVLGYTDLLLDGVVDAGAAPRARPLLGRIRDAALRLLSMIENLLDLTNLKLGRISLETQTCDASGLAREALAAQSFPETADIRRDLPDGPVPVHTDPRLVLRVLDCLLGNAAKFRPDGTITLRVRSGDADPQGAGERVIWEVEDDGAGIPPEHLEAIFDEFRQVDGSATRRVGGAGLGLALARAMATALGGGLTAYSGPGEGARFVLDLPREAG